MSSLIAPRFTTPDSATTRLHPQMQRHSQVCPAPESNRWPSTACWHRGQVRGEFCRAGDMSGNYYGEKAKEFCLAEEKGFEPPGLTSNGFQDRRLRPLGHSSRYVDSLSRSSSADQSGKSEGRTGLFRPNRFPNHRRCCADDTRAEAMSPMDRDRTTAAARIGAILRPCSISFPWLPHLS